jgi:hypothetical protein
VPGHYDRLNIPFPFSAANLAAKKKATASGIPEVVAFFVLHRTSNARRSGWEAILRPSAYPALAGSGNEALDNIKGWQGLGAPP